MNIDLQNCKALDLLSSLNENSVDFVLTDPPYNVDLNYDEYDDTLDNGEYWQWMKQVLKECERVVKDKGAIAFVTPKNQAREWMELIDSCGLNEVKGSPVVWCRSNIVGGMPFGNGYDFASYFIYVIDAGSHEVQEDPPRQADVTSFDWIVEPAPQSNFNEGRYHPAQQPVKVYEKLILKSTERGGLVVDPFVGSGTSAVACKKWDRDFVGCDISDGYLKDARHRVSLQDVVVRKQQSLTEVCQQ